ncbi:MAG: hypothetical protein ACD_15C00087G0001 [uncultured bacterium]|nr:MAG: hypothetical protein ACD_15C00087G0001 [uncultured bacterium]HCU70639.1 hypothetical protein [Candidatus Moranbacteria bacterium]
MRIVKDEVMQKIKERNIKMKPCFFFIIRKAGLESLLAFFIVFGAIALNSLFYFLKKTKATDFLFFGWVGLDNFLTSLPYDYIVLFIISILLANFLIHKFDLSYGISMNSNMALFFLLVITLALSSFFLLNGIEEVLSSYSKNKAPGKEIVLGEVMEFSDQEAIVREAGGIDWKLILEDAKIFDGNSCEKGKMLRAMGKEKRGKNHIFYADIIKCY